MLSLLRYPRGRARALASVANFTPVPRPAHRVGLPWGGEWRVRLNSDAECYGGSGLGDAGPLVAEPVPCDGREWSAQLVVPPLAIVVLDYSMASGGVEAAAQ